MIRTEEGYLSRSGSNYVHNLYIKDYLGNNRAVVRSDGWGGWNQYQEMSYFSFGMPFQDGNYSAELQPFKFGDKELDEMHGLKLYDHHARFFGSVIPVTTTPDPLAEVFSSMSPYCAFANNPVRYVDPTGMYFDETNEKKAQKLEKQIDRQVAKLEKQITKLEKAGKDIGDRRDRISTLQGSKSDISDMRNNESTEFRYGKTSDKNNVAGAGNPSILPTGTNDAGHNVVTMFADGVGSQIHETTHGGQVARGEYGFDSKGDPTAGYGLDSEVSATRAQYAFDGKFNYQQADYLSNTPTAADAFRALGSSVIPIITVSNINLINRALIQNIGVEGSRNGHRTWSSLYQHLK
jgi:RHS repeat-associated protein